MPEREPRKGKKKKVAWASFNQGKDGRILKNVLLIFPGSTRAPLISGKRLRKGDDKKKLKGGKRDEPLNRGKRKGGKNSKRETQLL